MVLHCHFVRGTQHARMCYPISAETQARREKSSETCNYPLFKQGASRSRSFPAIRLHACDPRMHGTACEKGNRSCKSRSLENSAAVTHNSPPGTCGTQSWHVDAFCLGHSLIVMHQRTRTKVTDRSACHSMSMHVIVSRACLVIRRRQHLLSTHATMQHL